MKHAIFKPLKNPKLFTSYVFLAIFLYTIGEYFTDREVMLGNYGKFHTYFDYTLSILVALLFPLFLIGIAHRGYLFGKKELLSKKWGFGISSGLIWVILSWASCCGPTLAVYFGLIPLMTWLPYDGIEIKLISIIVLLWANYDLYTNLETCRHKGK